MIQKSYIILLLSLVFVAVRVPGLRGFEVQTHTKLSEKATDSSQLNNFLTTTLWFEFPQGVLQEVGEGEFSKVRQLIADVGAVNEDKPDTRSGSHFHDPTKVWTEAGLFFLTQYQSSILLA